jgi:hypothetical protein
LRSPCSSSLSAAVPSALLVGVACLVVGGLRSWASRPGSKGSERTKRNFLRCAAHFRGCMWDDPAPGTALRRPRPALKAVRPGLNGDTPRLHVLAAGSKRSTRDVRSSRGEVTRSRPGAAPITPAVTALTPGMTASAPGLTGFGPGADDRQAGVETVHARSGDPRRLELARHRRAVDAYRRDAKDDGPAEQREVRPDRIAFFFTRRERPGGRRQA